MNLEAWWPYALLATAAVAGHLALRRRRDRYARHALQENVAAGLNEPASLHPVVDPSRCIGSGSCVKACPEQALGMVDGKAVLVNASACIGHGACHAACPFDAITLVFGTAKRGVEIPLLKPNFETNVPGLFIAGELGGMGLIRKAAEQGRQAMEAIVQRGRATGGDAHYDVVIVGAGPAGLSAGLTALEHDLRHAIVEQEHSLGGAIFHYPRQKLAMTAPVRLALVGQVVMHEISKENLLAFWQGVMGKFRLAIRFGERMEHIEPEGDGFLIRTSRGTLHARSVLLAIGRRGTPRTLGVPGEDLPMVTYRLVDAQQYAGQSVLVVGGGDSALEAALALAEVPGTQASISYRGEAFSRAKARNREHLQALRQAGRAEVYLGSAVQRIEPGLVHLTTAEGQPLRLEVDAVIVCAGGVLPTPLLRDIGIRFETKHGTA